MAGQPGAWAQFLQQGNKLTGSVGGAQATFGAAAALSADGNTAIMGGPGYSYGAVWVFTRSGGTWTQQSSALVGSGLIGPYQEQGTAVALSGDGSTAIVGAPGDNNHAGAVYVFTRSGSVWTQQGGKLVGTGAAGAAHQGNSVAISGDGNTAIVGGPFDNNEAGAAWVFVRSGSTWRQQGNKLVGSGAAGNASQGYVALSADGNRAIVGGPGDNNAGAFWVFTRTGGVWTQEGSKVAAPQGYTGMGRAVATSIDGSTVIAGMPFGSGGAFVFAQSNGVWAQQGRPLVGSRSPLFSGEQGWSVALSSDGNTAVTGGPLGGGAAWVFGRTGGAWAQIGDPLSGSDVSGIPGQGNAVAISGDGGTVPVGGPEDNGYAGAAWIYARSSQPYILSNGVVNGASFQPGIAPGEWITIEGLNLSTTTRTWQAADFQGNNLPTQLDGVQVTVNGKCAYVYYISPTQLNVPAPDDTAAGSVPVQVTNLQGSSNTVSAAESAIAPALFELANPPGTYVAAVRSDGMYLGPDTPAKPGDTILLFGTGFGPTAPPSATGQLVSGPVQLAGTAIVQINEINVIPTYSGLTGAGLYQFNVVVPNVPDGDRLVTVSVGDAVTPKLLLTVRH